MSQFTLVLHEPGSTDPDLHTEEEEEDDKTDKINCCFVCSKPIELQTKTGGLNDGNLIQILFELLTSEKCCSTTENDLLSDKVNDRISVGFCPECRLYLRLWNDLMTSIAKILEKTNQIKSNIISNILTSSNKIPRRSMSLALGKDRAESAESLSLLQKLVSIKKKIRDCYSPKVVLEKLKSSPSPSPRVVNIKRRGVGSDEGTDLCCNGNEKPEVFDKDEQRIDPDLDGETIEFGPDSEMTENDTTAENDAGSNDENVSDTIAIEAKSRERKPKKSKNWKTVGPQELLYRGSYTVYEKDGGFVCALCLVKTKTKDNMRGHVNVVHLKHPKKQQKYKPIPSSVLESTDQPDGSKQFLYHGRYSARFDPSENTFSCGSCQGQFEKLSGVLTHIRSIHYTEEDKQEFTAVKLNDLEYLYGGKYKIFRRNQRFHCGLCGSGQRTLSAVYSHLRAKHIGKDNDDEQMLQELPGQISMEIAPDFNSVENGASTEIIAYMGIGYYFDQIQLKYKCMVCASSANRQENIRAHIRNVHIDPEKKFVCEECGEALKTRTTLRTHKRRWHGDGPTFICKYCDKVFKNKPYFDCHVAIHEKGEEAKNFQCEYCGKKFADQVNCVKHVRTHTKETPYACSLCDKKFTNTGSLCSHRKKIHNILPKKQPKVNKC